MPLLTLFCRGKGWYGFQHPDYPPLSTLVPPTGRLSPVVGFLKMPLDQGTTTVCLGRGQSWCLKKYLDLKEGTGGGMKVDKGG